MTAIPEEITEELEVLQAIYGDDFEERPPVWNIPSFAIRIAPTKSSKLTQNENTVTGELKLSFNLYSFIVFSSEI